MTNGPTGQGKIVSFAQTVPALLAGAKTVTRRQWSPRHAAWFTEGRLFQAWNRLPRVKGAVMVAVLRVVSCEQTRECPEGDFEKEGLAWLRDHGTPIFLSTSGLMRDWVAQMDEPPFRLEFSVESILPAGHDLLADFLARGTTA